MDASTNTDRNRGKLLALAAAAFGLTLASGAVYGRWTQRWGPPVDLQAAADQMATLPRQVGDWRMIEELPVLEAVVETLQCAGYVHRSYVHQGTGWQVNVALIVGPPGPTSVHTPEICFSSRNYDLQEPRKKWWFKPPGGLSHSLWMSTFRSANAGSDALRVYYGWSRGEEWLASESPRYEFGGARLLYKIQASTSIDPAETGETRDPCQDFVESLLQTFWHSPPA